jgi:bifunctional enzyme CysN/CysC
VVARLFFEAGNIVLCTFVSPFRADRDRVRALLPEGRFVEIHVDADLETVKARDPKGLYQKAERGEILHFTGISSPYEAPESAEIRLDTTQSSVEESVRGIVRLLRQGGVVEKP